MSVLDIDAYTPDSFECKDSKFIYPSAGHVAAENLKIIPGSRIRITVFALFSTQCALFFQNCSRNSR